MRHLLHLLLLLHLALQGPLGLAQALGGALVRLEIEAPSALVAANRRPRPDTAWAREILRNLPQA